MKLTLDHNSCTASLGEGCKPVRFVMLTVQGKKTAFFHVCDFLTSALDMSNSGASGLWYKFKKASSPEKLAELFQLQTHKWPGIRKMDVMPVMMVFNLVMYLRTRKARMFLRKAISIHHKEFRYYLEMRESMRNAVPVEIEVYGVRDFVWAAEMSSLDMLFAATQ